MNDYGFQKMGLLNSADYLKAELPLDDTLSLCAENNIGKTSLINALQFLLVGNKLDFGEKAIAKSKSFYFKSNDSYILLEVALPTGTVVIGCVGFGLLGGEYQYFVYKGHLNLNDYRTEDNTIVKEPFLVAHMAKLGYGVHKLQLKDYLDGLYTTTTSAKKKTDIPDFNIFRLDRSYYRKTFQRVLTAILNLKKMTSQDVKDYTLEIFSHGSSTSPIDFKREWTEAFSAITVRREQYQAAITQKNTINSLREKVDTRDRLVGKLKVLNRLLPPHLEDWNTHYRTEQQRFKEAIAQCHKEKEILEKQREEAAISKGILLNTNNSITENIKAYENRAQEMLLWSLDALKADRGHIESKIEEITIRLAPLQLRPKAEIDKAIAKKEALLSTLSVSLSNTGHDLRSAILQAIPNPEAQKLMAVLRPEILSLSVSDFDLNEPFLRDWGTHSADTLCVNGITINNKDLILKIIAENSEQTESDIKNSIAECQKDLDGLYTSLETLNNEQKYIDEKENLKKSLAAIQLDISRYNTFMLEKEKYASWLETRKANLIEIDVKQQIYALCGEKISATIAHRKQLETALDKLQIANTEIDNGKKINAKYSDVFNTLDLYTEIPFMQPIVINPNNLAQYLAELNSDMQHFVTVCEDIESTVTDLHRNGLTQFISANTAANEDEIQNIIHFADHLDAEKQTLDSQTAVAFINLTAGLKGLMDDINLYKGTIKHLNSLIGKRKPSNLEYFKIKVMEVSELVTALKTILNAANKADETQTSFLFDCDTVLKDSEVENARKLLTETGLNNGLIQLSDFFNLEFEAQEIGKKSEKYTSIDSAASNGTVMMLKMLTGMALLHQMLSIGHNIQLICYIDEGTNLDSKNQAKLIDAATSFGFSLVFASPQPISEAHYFITIQFINGHKIIDAKNLHRFIKNTELEGHTNG